MRRAALAFVFVTVAPASVGVTSMLVSAALVGGIVRWLGEPPALCLGLVMGIAGFALGVGQGVPLLAGGRLSRRAARGAARGSS